MALITTALTERGLRNLYRGEGSALSCCVVCGARRPTPGMYSRCVPEAFYAQIGFMVVVSCNSAYCNSRIDAGGFSVRPTLRERIARG